MRDGYVIGKCLRCGSTIFLKISGVKGVSSQCPVCAEYELSIIQIQPCLQLGMDMTQDITAIPDYIQEFLENATN